MADKTERVKELEKKISALEREIRESEQITTDMAAKISATKTQLKQLLHQLSQLQPREIAVTDHALVRYAERYHGLPMEQIREELRQKLSGAIGNIRVDGFVIKNNAVVTYLTPSSARGTNGG
jgi:septal ring factor EnvC (AmiA/AmiB activator)